MAQGSISERDRSFAHRHMATSRDTTCASRELISRSRSSASREHQLEQKAAGGADLSVGGVERDVPRDRPLPAVAVREETFLVVVELLGCLSRELDVWSQDDGVNRAGLLAEAAVDAFHHIDVEAGGPTSAVVAPLPRLDGDGLCRANRLAQLAGDATLLPIRIAPQRKLAAKAG